MVTNILKRPRGRPKGFIPDEALDRAVEMFWEHGYEGVDVDRIARAVNVTNPRYTEPSETSPPCC